ncbi:MAG: hypothetical protein P4L87_20235, partial [Formivibrio sp.]|nr:hypothetical protein [Formivibrio sp.]
GHAGVSWVSPPGGYKDFASADTFLLSVTGPYTTAPVRFPVKAGKAGKAVACHAGRGPVFNGGLYVLADNKSPTACFDGGSSCNIGNYYEDTIGMGKKSLTGSQFYVPVEVEAFAITCAPM